MFLKNHKQVESNIHVYGIKELFIFFYIAEFDWLLGRYKWQIFKNILKNLLRNFCGGWGAKLKLKLGKHAYTYKLYIACVFYSVLMYHGVQPKMVLVVNFF